MQRQWWTLQAQPGGEQWLPSELGLRARHAGAAEAGKPPLRACPRMMHVLSLMVGAGNLCVCERLLSSVLGLKSPACFAAEAGKTPYRHAHV